MQGVLLEASRRLADYLRRPAMPFQLWLRQIARDQLIDVHRRHRVAGRRSIDRERSIAPNEFFDRSSMDLASALRDQGPTPAAEAIRHELVDRFHAALQELGEDDREILVMRHFEHLTNAESRRGFGSERAGSRDALLACLAPAARSAYQTTQSGTVKMSLERSEEPVLPGDAELARLLAEMIETASQGRIPDIEAAVRRDPALSSVSCASCG